MNKVISLLFALVIMVVLIGCSNEIKRLSGNPSEILEMEVYNKLQQKYKSIKNFQEGTAIVQKDKFGLINCDGIEILPCEYDSISDLEKCFRVIVKDSLFGATNIDGEIIKECIYSGAEDNSCNYLALKSNDKWGFIDAQGKDITQYKYEEIRGFDDSVFVAKYDGYMGVSNYQNRILIPFKYDDIWYQYDETCPVSVVKLNGRNGLYNSKNELVLECEYGPLYPDSSGYIVVTKEESDNYKTKRKALIEAETGKIMIPFEYMDMTEYSEGLIGVENLKEKWGYMDLNGNVVIPFKYYDAGAFSEGLAPVYEVSGYASTYVGTVQTHKCGYIDKKGNVVIPFKFQEVIGGANFSVFHDGLAVQGIGKNNVFAQKYGYINTKGDWVVEPQFDGAEDFENGLGQVQISDKYGYVNTKGELVIPCIYDKYGGRFVNDSIIRLKKDGIECYLNVHGKSVSKPQMKHFIVQ